MSLRRRTNYRFVRWSNFLALRDVEVLNKAPRCREWRSIIGDTTPTYYELKRRGNSGFTTISLQLLVPMKACRVFYSRMNF